MQALPFVIALITARALAPAILAALAGERSLAREDPRGQAARGQAPAVQPPEAAAPEAGAPEAGAPEAGAPEAGMPAAALPAATLPAAAVPAGPGRPGRLLPFPLGVLVVLAALLTLIPVALIERLDLAEIYPDDLALVMLFVPGVALIGLLADMLAFPAIGTTHAGSQAAITLRALLLAATLGLALLAASYLPGSEGDFLVAAGVLLLSVHVFGVLNAGPGRPAKALILLGAGLLLATWDEGPLETVGIFMGPALVASWYDLRGAGLLGASGASVIGAVAGLWIVLALSPGEQAIALLALVALAVFEQARSISAGVEKLPGLRHLDSLGRPS